MDEYIVSETITTNEQNNEEEETKTVVKATGDNASPVAIPEGATEQTLTTTLPVAPTFGGTYVAAQQGETHKGIIYLDPTNLARECNSNPYDETTNPNGYKSTTETKSGYCMRWYIYKETATEYTMILDHNTTARLAFSDTSLSGTETTDLMVSEINARLAYDTSDWQIASAKKKVIEATEIAVITGKTNATTTWDYTLSDDYFYFDTGTTSMSTSFTSTNRSAYAWLYNNTYQCKPNDDYPNMTDYGCTNEDNSTSYETFILTNNDWGTTGTRNYSYGYWTSTPVESPSYVWYVDSYGRLHRNDASNTNRGIRPVITVSKSLIN